MALITTLSKALSDYAFGVASDMAATLALANALAPVVETGVTNVQYITFDDDNAFQKYNARRGIGGKRQRILFGASETSVILGANGLEIPIDDQEKGRAGDSFNALEQAKVKTLVTLGYNAHLTEVATVLQAGVSAEAGKGVWSGANVDPIDEIDEQIEAIARYGMPNRMVLDIGAWRKAKNNPKVKARFSAKGFTLQDFASQLLNPGIQIHLTAVGLNTYGFGNASQTKTAAIGSECWIFNSLDAATAYDPSMAKTFATRKELFNGVGIYRDESCASEVYFIDWTALPKVISTKLGRRLSIS
jgi:hypothetical protein